MAPLLSLFQATAVYQAKEKLKSIDKARKGERTHLSHTCQMDTEVVDSALVYDNSPTKSSYLFVLGRKHLIRRNHQIRSQDQRQQRRVRSSQLGPR